MVIKKIAFYALLAGLALGSAQSWAWKGDSDSDSSSDFDLSDKVEFLRKDIERLTTDTGKKVDGLRSDMSKDVEDVTRRGEELQRENADTFKKVSSSANAGLLSNRRFQGSIGTVGVLAVVAIAYGTYRYIAKRRAKNARA